MRGRKIADFDERAALEKSGAVIGFAAAGILLAFGCEEVPFPAVFVYTTAEDVEVCPDPQDDLPVSIEEFEVFADGPTGGSIDPQSYETRIDYAASSEAVALSVPSGTMLPLGRTSLDVLLESDDFDQATIDLEVTLSGERSDGSAFQTGWLGRIEVTNTCP